MFNGVSNPLLTIVIVIYPFVQNKISYLKGIYCFLEVTHSDATTLTTTLLSYFENNNIPIENTIGYVSDTTNVMFGEHYSVVSLLKEKIPYLFVMKCLFHSVHLCASHGYELTHVLAYLWLQVMVLLS